MAGTLRVVLSVGESPAGRSSQPRTVLKQAGTEAV